MGSRVEKALNEQSNTHTEGTQDENGQGCPCQSPCLWLCYSAMSAQVHHAGMRTQVGGGRKYHRTERLETTQNCRHNQRR